MPSAALPASLPRRLNGIQHLRALAAIGVVVFHAAEKAGLHFTIGAAGVDIFFVISGFIMWVIAAGRPITPLRFLGERIARIVPLYWLATAVMVCGALAGLFPNLRISAGYVAASLFFIPARSPGDGQVWPVLVQGWTLNYEMFFYVLFAAALLLPDRLRLAALVVLLGGCVALGRLVAPESTIAFTLSRPLLLEFLAGILIGVWWLHGAPSTRLAGFVVVAAAAAGFAAIAVTGRGFQTLLLAPLSALLVGGVLVLERWQAVPRLPLVAYLGDCSYSVYLWHTFAISVVLKAAVLMGLPSAATMAGGAVGGVLAGVVCYELLERPLSRIFHGRQGGWRLRRRVTEEAAAGS